MITSKADYQQNKIQLLAFIVAIIICVLVSISLVTVTSTHLKQSAHLHLDFQINPNTAPPESLMRLPGIGNTKACAIVSYRDNFAKNNKIPAFKDYNDLQKIKGIGPKTVQKISKWLKFE